MADDPTNPNSTPNNTPASGADTTTPPTTTPTAPPTADQIKLAEELGMARKENESLKDYQARVDPFLQTVWSDSVDEETRNKLLEAHNKRLGITTDTPKDDKGIEDKTPIPSETEKDNRNALIKTIVDKFSTDHGIDKLPVGDPKNPEPGTQAYVNNRVGVELREMLDPMGNKTLQQIMETVSVTKLSTFLEKAHFLATRNEQLEEAEKKGQQQAANDGIGMIGSIPSSSLDNSDITLTAKEKEIARKQGISEEKYLANKKEIAARDGQLF